MEMKKKRLTVILMGVLFVGGLTGCGMLAALPGRGYDAIGGYGAAQGYGEMQGYGAAQGYGEMQGYGVAQGYGVTQGYGVSQEESALSQVPYETTSVTSYDGECGDCRTDEDAGWEQLRIYEPFGMTYDADRNELYYNGKSVRWFEDYYLVGDDPQAKAGRDFFNENGVVDIYAVRNFDSFKRAADGSYDPSGELVGLQEFTEEEFAARDIEALKNPPKPVAMAGGPAASAEEMQEMAKEYESFGLTYDAKADQWYLGDEKVRYFRDILTSNGERLSSGRFRGSMRSFGSEEGTVDVYTVRDYGKVNAQGYGTLTGLETEVVTRQLPGGRVDYRVYEPYGLFYDEKSDCYTYNGSVVRFFNDPAVGAGFTNFFTGTVDIEAKRDENNELTGIVECSQEVYDYHTQKQNRLHSGLIGPNTVLESGTGQN